MTLLPSCGSFRWSDSAPAASLLDAAVFPVAGLLNPRARSEVVGTAECPVEAVVPGGSSDVEGNDAT